MYSSIRIWYSKNDIALYTTYQYNRMNPCVLKFNQIALDKSILSPVKDLIFERYVDICKDEIEQFYDHNFLCLMCAEWLPRSQHGRMDICLACTENYVVWRCKNCDHVFEDCVIIARSRDEAYCGFCYEYEIDHTCICGEVYKLNKGINDRFCSKTCCK